MCTGTCGRCYQCQDTCNCVPLSYADAPLDKIDAEGVIYNMDTNCSTSNLMCFFGIRNGTNLKVILEKLDEKLCQIRGLFDEKVKVSVDDTSEGYLFTKIETHDCITKQIITDVEGNQKLLLGIDCNCIKSCIDDTPLNCFLPIYGNPIRVCNGSVTTVQINTINTGVSVVQFSINEGITWVDGTPNTFTFTFPSDGSLQKIKARLKGCDEYADGFVSLCTVSSPVAPPVTPIAPTPVAPSPVAPTTPVSPTPVFVPVTPVVTPTTPIAPTPVPVVPSTTPITPTPIGCIQVSNFDYTINGNSNVNGFTITGVQDINIVVTGYSPNNANTPIFYEYILDGFSSGVISNNSKSFPSVNIGNHLLSIIVSNCSGSITKNINFAISNTTVPVAPTPISTPVTPSAPTTMYYNLTRCDGGGGERSVMNIPNLPIGTVVKLSDNNCYTITGTSSTVTTNVINSVEANCNSCLGVTPTTPVAPTPVTPTTPVTPSPVTPTSPPAYREILLGNPTSSTSTEACGVTSGNTKYIDYTFEITNGLVIWNDSNLTNKTYNTNPGNWSMLYDTTGANGVNGGKRYAVQFDGSGNINNIVDCTTLTPVTPPTTPVAPTPVPVAPTPVGITCTNYLVSNDSGNTLNYSFTCCKLNSLVQDTINSGQTKTICAITGSFSSENGEVTFTSQGSCTEGDECFIV